MSYLGFPRTRLPSVKVARAVAQSVKRREGVAWVPMSSLTHSKTARVVGQSMEPKEEDVEVPRTSLASCKAAEPEVPRSGFPYSKAKILFRNCRPEYGVQGKTNSPQIHN